jgi:hypothetical protein
VPGPCAWILPPFYSGGASTASGAGLLLLHSETGWDRHAGGFYTADELALILGAGGPYNGHQH